MNNIKRILNTTIKNTVLTTIKLAKILIPVVFLVTFIKMTGTLQVIAHHLEPLVKIFNLPGEASLPLILGGIVNLYAGISSIETLELTNNQITTIAIMMLIAHSLLVETAVISSLGVKKTVPILIRIVIAIFTGLLVSLIVR
ncbi:MAG: nucleoside recognition domain-containing protein [Bacilli bacterium]